MRSWVIGARRIVLTSFAGRLQFLQQLQDFAGVLIACTNRPEAVDQAIRRRFHRHVYFGPLPPALLQPALAHMFPDVTFTDEDHRVLLDAPTIMMSDIATARELFEVSEAAGDHKSLADSICDESARQASLQIIDDILESARSREMSHTIGF